MLYVGGKYFKIAHLNVRRDKKDTALILKCKRWGGNPNSYSLTYFESTGTGTDDTGTSFYGTGTGTDGTDSTSTDAFDIGTILSHFH